MKVLVAGATGVLGPATVRLLLAQGHEVIALFRSEKSQQLLKSLGAQPVKADVLDAAGITSLAQGVARGVEAVLNLATVIPRDATVPGAWLPNDKVRVEGTRNLIDLARKAGALRLVQQSITRIYRDNGDAWIDESTPLAAKQPVHLDSTVIMEGLVNAVQDLQTVILRGGQFYGAGTSTTEGLFDKARSGTLRLDGDGSHFISPIHPEDMAQAAVIALTVPRDTGVLNVVDDKPLTQRDFFATVAALASPDCKLVAGDSAMRMPSRRCSNKKIKAMGFTPKYPSHKEGLEDAYARQK